MRAPTNPEEVEFQNLWGPWAVLTPADAAGLLDGLGLTWWVAGGRAIDAFTGTAREHGDIDVGMFREDIADLRHALKGRLHIWSAGADGLRPVDDRFPEVATSADQVWLRENAHGPWLLDVLLNPRRDGMWVNRREPSIAVPLDEVTWVDADGIRYLNPERVLGFKAKMMRPKDRHDMDRTLHLLDETRRGVLRAYLEDYHPGHEWLNLL
ncbi:hypothetical protein AB0N05_33910 [Nocardia sp. NPDC051030]|uniref:nucleotidyltransferase domain-containing protein n=1 Tax=Nocardia sp. NPDC051030 TaxID=3155162 RepID=UPI0034199362